MTTTTSLLCTRPEWFDWLFSFASNSRWKVQHLNGWIEKKKIQDVNYWVLSVCEKQTQDRGSLTVSFLLVSVSQLWQSLLQSVAVQLSTPQLCVLLVTPQLQTVALARRRRGFSERGEIVWRYSDSYIFNNMCLTLARSHLSMSWSRATCSSLSLSCSYKIQFRFRSTNHLLESLNFFTHPERVSLVSVLLPVSPPGGAVRELSEGAGVPE